MGTPLNEQLDGLEQLQLGDQQRDREDRFLWESFRVSVCQFAIPGPRRDAAINRLSVLPGGKRKTRPLPIRSRRP